MAGPKTYSGAAGVEAGRPSTKIRAEQVKSEDGFTSLAVDLEALRGQVKDIIGAADYKEEITGEYAKVQIVDLAAHLDASGASSLSVKQAANVVGAFSVNTDKLTVAAATGNTAIKGTLDVDGQATLASANVEDLTSGRIVVAGASGELGDFSGLTFVGGELTAASATVSDLTSGRVVYAGASGALVDSAEMTFGAGGLTLVKDLSARSGSFSGDVTVAGDLFVQGNTVQVDVGTLTIEDKNVVIAKDASGALLDGAGIFLGSEVGGESISWNHADTKWVASDKFAADTLQATDLSSAIVWADGSGNLVEISAADLGAAIDARLVEGTGVHISEAAGAVTIAIGQAVETTSTVTFAAVTGSNLTASRLMASNADKGMVSADLYSWVAETANQVLVANDGDGTITLSLPQDIHSAASPQFAQVKLDGADNYVDSSASGLVLHAGLAGDSIVFEYDAGKTISLGTAALVGFTATDIMGALNELKATASAASKKALYSVTGAAVAAGTNVAGSVTWPGGTSFLSELTGQNTLVFVNGMLMQSGGTDFTLNVAGGSLSFAFELQAGDVVIIQKA